jgi:hypothetical protein
MYNLYHKKKLSSFLLVCDWQRELCFLTTYLNSFISTTRLDIFLAFYVV